MTYYTFNNTLAPSRALHLFFVFHFAQLKLVDYDQIGFSSSNMVSRFVLAKCSTRCIHHRRPWQLVNSRDHRITVAPIRPLHLQIHQDHPRPPRRPPMQIDHRRVMLQLQALQQAQLRLLPNNHSFQDLLPTCLTWTHSTIRCLPRSAIRWRLMRTRTDP